MYFLKLLGRPLLEYLQPLFQACFQFSHHPLHLKQSSTVALRKHSKGDYSAPADWQHVVHLATLGKVLETVMASKITGLSVEYGLLPSQHMGTSPQRPTDTALVKQTKAEW
jgi:hypothetical protein